MSMMVTPVAPEKTLSVPGMVVGRCFRMRPIKNAKVAVVGSRYFKDYDEMKRVLDAYREKHGLYFIVSGGARGADELAERYAKEREISYTIFVAEWSKYRNKAGPRRNLKIVETCDVVIAFPGPKSKGTWNTINLARKMKKPVYVFEWGKEDE